MKPQVRPQSPIGIIENNSQLKMTDCQINYQLEVRTISIRVPALVNFFLSNFFLRSVCPHY